MGRNRSFYVQEPFILWAGSEPATSEGTAAAEHGPLNFEGETEVGRSLVLPSGSLRATSLTRACFLLPY